MGSSGVGDVDEGRPSSQYGVGVGRVILDKVEHIILEFDSS